MVVVTIIGILAALLLPTLVRARQSARRTQCASNLRQIGIGLQAFLADYHAYPSAFAMTNGDLPGRWWAQQLERGGLGDSTAASDFDKRGVWLCPSAHWPNYGPGGYASYSYNGFGVLEVGNLTNAPGLLGHYDSAWGPDHSHRGVGGGVAGGDDGGGRQFFHGPLFHATEPCGKCKMERGVVAPEPCERAFLRRAFGDADICNTV
jgi:type II secretory pathway pseudopilin PulG